MGPKDVDGIANSVDPDQTASLGAVWSGSAMYAQTCLSENLGSLRYVSNIFLIHTDVQVPVCRTPKCETSTNVIRPLIFVTLYHKCNKAPYICNTLPQM